MRIELDTVAQDRESLDQLQGLCEAEAVLRTVSKRKDVLRIAAIHGALNVSQMLWLPS